MKIFLLILFCAVSAAQAQELVQRRFPLVPVASASWTPADISGILQFNYGDASSAAAGDPISSWTATVGNNLTTGTGSTRPTIETNLVAGKAIKVVRFDGADDYLTNKFTSVATNGFTMFSTYRLRTNSNLLGVSQRVWDSAFNESARNLLMHDTAPQILYYNGSFGSLADSQTNWLITVIVVDGANTRMSTNGATWNVIGSTSGGDGPNGATLAASNDGSSNPAFVNFENFGVIANTNTSVWFVNLTNWMHGRLY